MDTTLRGHLDRWRCRASRMAARGRFLDLGLTLALATAALLLADRILYELRWAPLHASSAAAVWTITLGALAAAALAARHHAGVQVLSPARMAARADRALDAGETILTAWEAPANPWGDLLRREAVRRLAAADLTVILPAPRAGYRAAMLLGPIAAVLLHATLPAPPPAPRAGFWVSESRGSAPLTVRFTNTSRGAVERCGWETGDGTRRATIHAEHTYRAPGRYTARLVVRGPGGMSEAAQRIEVFSPDRPLARFEAEPRKGHAPLAAKFRNLSEHAERFRWIFGDGAESAEREPEHRYERPGHYGVTLEATGPAGSDRLHRARMIHVVAEDAPIADFRARPVEGEAPLEVGFEDLSTGRIDARRWDFGDLFAGTERLSVDRNPVHGYRMPGVYTVRLTVSGPGGGDLEIKERYIHVGRGSGTGEGMAESPSGVPRPEPEPPSPAPDRPGDREGRLYGDAAGRPKVRLFPEGVTPLVLESGPRIERMRPVPVRSGEGGTAPQDLPYAEAFRRYEQASEQTMSRESIPGPLQDYVRRYFDAIRPREP